MPETNCENCQTIVIADSKFCPKCGFPERGTLQEQEEFYDDYNAKLREAHDLQGSIDDSMRIMLLLGIVTLATGVGYFLHSQPIFAVTTIVMGVFFVSLTFWSTVNPFASLLVALCIYATFTLIAIFMDGVGLGLILRGIILFVLSRSTYHAYQLKHINEEINLKK